MDWTGGQIKDTDSAEDIEKMDLTKVHILSGPISVDGAEPNDLLVVDILDIGTFPQSEWGFTGIFSKNNGGGFLTNHYPRASKAIWKFEGRHATSRHIPGMIIECSNVKIDETVNYTRCTFECSDASWSNRMCSFNGITK